MKPLTEIIEKYGKIEFYHSDQTFSFNSEFEDVAIVLENACASDYENWFPEVWVSDIMNDYTEEERYIYINSISKVLDDVIKTIDGGWCLAERYNTEINATFN